MTFNLYIVVLIALFSVSSSSLVIRYTPEIPALTLAFWRMFIASGLLWVYTFYRERGYLSLTNRKRVLVAGVFLGLHFSAFFWGVRNTSIANATLLANTGPFFTALFAFITGKPLNKNGYIGLFLAGFGIFLIQGYDLDLRKEQIIGNVMSLFSGFFIAVTYVYAKKIRENTKNVIYGRSLFLYAAVTILVISFSAGNSPFVFQMKDFYWFLFLGFVPSILGHNLLNYSIKFLSPTAVASVPLGEPIIASIFGYIIFYEKVPIESLLGSPLVFLGIFFVLNSEKY